MTDEKLLEALKEARDVILALKAELEEAELNGDIVAKLLAARNEHIWFLQLEHEKLRLKVEELTPHVPESSGEAS